MRAITRRDAGADRFINLGGRQGLWQRPFTIEYADDMLCDEGLERHRCASTRFGKIVDVPAGRDQAEECLIESQHTLYRAMRQIVERKAWMFFAPGATPVISYARECRGAIAPLLEMDHHVLPPNGPRLTCGALKKE